MALLSYIRCSQHILGTVIVSTRWDLPSHFYATFVSYRERAPLKLWYIALDWGVEIQWNVFTCYSQPCLVLSNLPSLKEVIRSNMQYKNTIYSHCQPWDKTNFLSIYSVESYWDCWISQGCRSASSPGLIFRTLQGDPERDLRFYFKEHSHFFLATKKSRETGATFNWLGWCFTSSARSTSLSLSLLNWGSYLVSFFSSLFLCTVIHRLLCFLCTVQSDFNCN